MTEPFAVIGLASGGQIEVFDATAGAVIIVISNGFDLHKFFLNRHEVEAFRLILHVEQLQADRLHSTETQGCNPQQESSAKH